MGGLALQGTVRTPARVGRHPKVPAWWNIAARRSLTQRCYRAGGGAVSGDQAELPGPRGGLGAGGGADLAQDVGHVLLTVSSATTRSWPMRWFDLPAASSRSTSSSRPVSGSASPGAGPRRRLGLVMVPRFGLAGVQPAHGDQAEPEVADFGQQPMQRGLVSEQPADDRLLALPAELEAVEPGGPPAVQDTRHTDLIPGRPAGGAHSSPSQRPHGGAIASASARGPGRAATRQDCQTSSHMSTCSSWMARSAATARWAVRHTATTRRRVGWLAIIKITS